jgi:hypothetical protein
VPNVHAPTDDKTDQVKDRQIALGSWKFGTSLLAPLMKLSISVSVCILRVTGLLKKFTTTVNVTTDSFEKSLNTHVITMLHHNRGNVTASTWFSDGLRAGIPRGFVSGGVRFISLHSFHTACGPSTRLVLSSQSTFFYCS